MEDTSLALDRVPCIHYPLRFRKDTAEVKALIDSGSEVNAMTPTYAAKLGLKVRHTDVGAQKIDGSTLETFGMVLASFQVEDKQGRAQYFQKTFVLADIGVEMVLRMSFLTFSNVDIKFAEKELTWRSYTVAEALPTTRRVELINKKEFAKVALDENSETFVVHVATLEVPKITIHPSQTAQILGSNAVQIAALKQNKASIEVPTKYSDFSDVFLETEALVLPERIDLNEHAIELEGDKQPPYRPIYSPGPVELETLKAYIKTNLKTEFIRPSKFPASAPILFDKKPDDSLCLCMDYRGLNNFTIQNQHPLPLIGESLDRLGGAKRFTQLDLTSAYHRMRIRECDKWKTAFQTWYGHFEYQVMPFGLPNAPASFQGYINKILAEKLDIFVIVYLDDILIYTEDPGQGHVEAVRWVLDVLRKHGLYANLKKCRFHKDEVRFLGYVVSAQGVRMEDERIEAVKNWPEPTSVRDIQVFIGFANFYRRFIRGFSRIAAPLTSMLKTTGPSEESAPKAFRAGNDEVVGGGGGRADETRKNSSKTRKSKNDKSGNSTRVSTIGATGEPTFLTPDAKEAFNRLRQAFIKAPILRHFDPESHIRIETDASGYAIGGVLSQLSSDWVTPEESNSVNSRASESKNLVRNSTKSDFGQWHPVVYFSRKMIPAETWYKTHDTELLAIVEAFNTWCHYLEGCKHEVLVLTDYNNLRRFMDTKSLSSRQVRWAQELSRYHFQIDYWQGKVNEAADALFQFPQRSPNEEEKLRAKNTQILHRLQTSLTNASLSGLSTSAELSPLQRVLICGTYILPQLRQF